ncbi:helix-turn-helix domain-containing protein [Micromonospora sp. NPDC003776]
MADLGGQLHDRRGAQTAVEVIVQQRLRDLDDVLVRDCDHAQTVGRVSKCRRWWAWCGVVGRFTAFRFTVDPSPSQMVVLGRHAGASRFAFNQCLALVKEALDARRRGGSVGAVVGF